MKPNFPHRHNLRRQWRPEDKKGGVPNALLNRTRQLLSSLSSALPRRGRFRPGIYDDPGGQRNRLIKKTLARLSLLLLLITLCCGVGVAGFHLLGYSDIFRVTTVTIRGNRMVRDHQIRELASLGNTTGMLRINTARLAADIARHPWIDRVSVTRQWPSTLAIRVTEHVPLALVNSGEADRQRLFYVDRSGRLFAPVMTSRDVDFPVITGTPEQLAVKDGKITGKSAAAEALHFLRLARKSVVLPVQAVSEIHVDKEEGLIVYLVERPFPIYLGVNNIKRKFDRLQNIVRDLYRRQEFDRIAEIRMEYTADKVLVAKIGP